ncbi:MAG: DUF4375 domain-containing protein [Polyangiaceae bacterium]
MTRLTDSDAIVISDESLASESPTDVVLSNVAFVNALFGELLTPEEIAPDALRSYYVDYLEAQVMNGGFAQFVYNSRWDPSVVQLVREGLERMGAVRELEAFASGAARVDSTDPRALESFLASDYFGNNATRDAFNAALPAEFAEGLQAANAAWLRRHAKLVVAPIDEMRSEVRRRSAALPDRADRLARARAAEPRDLKLIRRLCEEAGHEFGRRTAADRRALHGQEVWAFFFVTDRGPHFMIDLGTSALMFPTTFERDVDETQLVARIACEPE